MTATSVLTECRARQVRLAIEGGALTFEGPPGAMDAALLGQIRQHKAELLEQLQAANDTTSRRWRVSPPGGAPFELSTLPLEGEAVIRAVLEAWNATPEELAEALAEAEGNPALLANWRREAEGLGLSAVLSVHPRAYFSGTLMPDDRITCRECRLLRPGGRCGSPTWGPRYQPPPRPHRCAEFLPRAGDPDQRSGRARWPGLGLGVAA